MTVEMALFYLFGFLTCAGAVAVALSQNNTAVEPSVSTSDRQLITSSARRAGCSTHRYNAQATTRANNSNPNRTTPGTGDTHALAANASRGQCTRYNE